MVICYVPALDLRWIDASACPYVSRLFDDFPSIELTNFPTVDNVPSMLTGVPPHEHGVWGPRFRAAPTDGGWSSRIVDSLPDLVTTTAQCAVHALRRPVELATVPPRRRRRYELMRFKFIKYGADNLVTQPIQGYPSFLSAAGSDRCRFRFETSLDGLDRALSELGDASVAIDMIEVHGLDEMLHWRIDDRAEVLAHLSRVDEFVRALHQKCLRSNRCFLLLSDHGMEPVERWIDMRPVIGLLRGLRDEADFFIENTRATFWLHTERARQRVLDALAGLEHGTIVGWRDLAQYGVRFADASYGDVYFYADAGSTLFPNDFYHPLANLVLSVTDRAQRARYRHPRHRGDHGYFPDSACERGYLLVADEDLEVACEQASITDVAPTILDLVGLPAAPTMRGRPAFRRGRGVS